MEANKLSKLVDLGIELELGMSALYRLFANSIPEDRDFWHAMEQEEKHHAMLLRSARDSFAKRDTFPNDLISHSIEDLKTSLTLVDNTIAQFQINPPTRCEACLAAIKLEQVAGEVHYAEFMAKQATNPVESVFQKLNRDDEGHVLRIRQHCDILRCRAEKVMS